MDPRRDRFLLAETNTRTAGFNVDIYLKLNHTPKNIFIFFHYKNGSARACIKADVRVMMLVFTNQLP